MENSTTRYEYTLLDVLAALAERWWVLIASALIAGVIAYFLAPTPAQVFRSKAVVEMTPSQDVLLSTFSSQIVDAGATQGVSAPASERYPTTDLYLVSVQGPDAESTKAQLQTYLDMLIARTTEMNSLEGTSIPSMIEKLEASIVDLRATKIRIESQFAANVGQTSTPASKLSELVDWRALIDDLLSSREAEIAALRSSGATGVSPKNIVLPPTAGTPAPTEQNRNKSAILFASAAFFVAAALILAIDLYRRIPLSNANTAKIERIRRAFGVPSKSKG